MYMKFYYKEWDKQAVEFPQGTVLLDEADLAVLEMQPMYPEFLCWEVWAINKVKENKEGYFDFNKNLLDIGAGLGEYCFLAPFKHAYAFEPNKRMIYKIHANAVLYDRVDEIDTFQYLLSDKVEDLMFDGFFSEIGGGLSYDTSKAGVVKTTVLDTFNLNNIGLIKVDVEGMEEKVLRGGLGTIIRNNYPPILFECWDVGMYGMPQDKHDSLFNFLKDFGYEIIEHWADSETHLAINSKYFN